MNPAAGSPLSRPNRNRSCACRSRRIRQCCSIAIKPPWPSGGAVFFKTPITLRASPFGDVIFKGRRGANDGCLKGNAMGFHNPIGVVIKALQRQRRKAVEGASPRAEPTIEVMRGDLQNSPTHSARIENPHQLTGTKDNLIRARYALTVLRVARTSDQETAARLVRGVAQDFPHPNELPEIADIHQSAIKSLLHLAASLGDATHSRRHPWTTALGAAEDWFRAVDARQ